MAKAICFERTGDPDVLEIVDRPTPEPGAGEAVIDMHAIGLNRADALFRSGKYLIQPTPPSGLGIEGAGVIRAIGANDHGLTAGQRVSILPAFPQGGRYATYAEQALVPAASLVVIPPSLDDIGGAALWTAYLTAWGGMVERGGLGRGDFVLISAAASSVGLAAIAVATAVGAVPIATTRQRGKVEALHRAGAPHVIVADEDVPAAIRRITGNVGLRLAFDPIAGRFAESLVPCMAEEGRIIFYGGLSDELTQFDRRASIGKGLSFTGFIVRQIIGYPERLQRGIAFVLSNLAAGTIDPHIDRVFAFEDVVEAHRYIETNQQIGKIVLKV